MRESNPYRISNDIWNNKSNFNLYSIYQGVKPKIIRKLNSLKMNIEKKAAYENIHKKKKLSKTIYENNPTYFLYIPNSAKYRHISYQKDYFFNKEFHSNKKMNKKIEYH